VTETRTTRFSLAQWSSGDDSPGRDDFNDSFAAIEVRAAMDRRTPAAALPTGSPAMVSAEYFQRLLDLGGGNTAYALYRTDAGGTWRAQSWIPERLLVRPPDTAPAVTAEAFRVEHTSVTNGPGLSASWDGGLTLRKQLILGGSADKTLGRLSVGTLDAMPAAVRARVTAFGAERGLEIAAGDANVTELLRLINSSGSNVLIVNAAGQLTSTQNAAFGGVTPDASATLTVGPQAVGAITTGLLGYGQESAPTRVIWQANRYQPGSSDAGAIASVAPNLITLGRVSGSDWGQLDFGAVLTRLVTARLAWFPTIASIGGGTFNALPGVTGFAGIDATNGLQSSIGASLHNYGSPTRVATTFSTYPSSTNTWTGDLSRWNMADIVSGSPDLVNVAKVDPAGRLQSNASWRGSGTRPVQLRDVRQGITHYCQRKWADPGDYPAGLFVGSNSSVTYTWPTMTVRSSTLTQLEAHMRMELLFFKLNSGATPDRQVAQVRWSYSINGGSFVSANTDYQEGAATTVDSQWPQAPGVQCMWTCVIPVSLSAGSTFRLRMQVLLYPYASDARLRRADLFVRETIIESYNASE
jgi:hypothetical protein